MQTGTQITVPNVMPTEPLPTTTDAKPEAPANTKPTGVRIVVTERTSALTVEDANGQRALLRARDDRQPARPAANRQVEGHRRAADADVSLQPRPVLGRVARRTRRRRSRPGPNNPVGVAWIDLSKPHYGIHGTPEPSQIGHVQSHGCVRMTNWDVRRVMEWARPGTLVVFNHDTGCRSPHPAGVHRRDEFSHGHRHDDRGVLAAPREPALTSQRITHRQLHRLSRAAARSV